MKKNRNAFFQEYGYNINSMPNMMMPNIPNTSFSANSNFYTGPMNANPNMYSDIDSRLSKIERQINRLENRVSRLEGDNQNNNINGDDYSSNNMYMV